MSPPRGEGNTEDCGRQHERGHGARGERIVEDTDHSDRIEPRRVEAPEGDEMGTPHREIAEGEDAHQDPDEAEASCGSCFEPEAVEPGRHDFTAQSACRVTFTGSLSPRNHASVS